MSYFYAISGRWETRISHAKRLLDSARTGLSVETQAWIIINELGYMLISRADWSAALAVINEGKELLHNFIGEDDSLLVKDKSTLRDEENVRFIRCLATRYAGLIAAGMGNPESGIADLNRAIDGFLLVRRRTVAANTRIELGETYLLVDDGVRGREELEKALDYHLAQAADKPWVNTWIARAKLASGEIAFRENDYELAQACYMDSAERSRIVGNINGVAMATGARARVFEALRDFRQARDLANLAREDFLTIGRDAAADEMAELAVRCEGAGELSDDKSGCTCPASQGAHAWPSEDAFGVGSW
jgi:tetratricopeptide (TPR) repeat protein